MVKVGDVMRLTEVDDTETLEAVRLLDPQYRCAGVAQCEQAGRRAMMKLEAGLGRCGSRRLAFRSDSYMIAEIHIRIIAFADCAHSIL